MTMLGWNRCPAVVRSPDKVNGVWVFRDSRVTVKALFENLEDGATIDDFLAWFPGVRREQVLAVRKFAEQISPSPAQPAQSATSRLPFCHQLELVESPPAN